MLLVLTPQVRVLAPSQGLLGLPGMLPGLLLGLLVLVLILLLASSPGAVRVLAEALMVRSPMRSKDSAQAQVLVQQLWAPAVTTYQTVSDNCGISTSWIIMASASQSGTVPSTVLSLFLNGFAEPAAGADGSVGNPPSICALTLEGLDPKTRRHRSVGAALPEPLSRIVRKFHLTA